MDFKNVVYNAARDGKLRRLKVFLDHRTSDEVLMLVATKTNGATPLVMACRNGHSEVVEYLVDRCNADLEQPGSVVFDGETIEGAPPLWCAAAAGHYQVVRFLVKRGASVNSITKTNSTPLRAACFDGHFDIVKFLVDHGADIEVANRHGHTCLMIACYKGHYQIAQYLLGLGANVNRKSVKGNTALHDCAESGSLNILKMLLQHRASMDVDSYGMTPLLAASVTGHSHIVEFLISQPSVVSRQESIDALELLGATFVDKKRDMIGALDFWKRAMAIRFAEGQVALPKPAQMVTVDAYEHAREKRTAEELDDLLADPDDMRMQALLIRERILGPAHPDTSYYVRYRGAVYADAGKFSRCISLWSYALDMQQAMLDPLNPMTQSSLFSFTELFSFMMGEEGRGRGRVPTISLDDLLSVLEKAVNEVSAGLQVRLPTETCLTSVTSVTSPSPDPNHLHRVVVISLHLACLAVRLELSGALSQTGKDLKKLLYRLVTLKPRTKNHQTPLHLACNEDAALITRYPACRLPNSKLVEALVTVGSDVSAVDAGGNTALHVTAKCGAVPPELVSVLLKAGCHLDSINYAGETFASLLGPDQPLVSLCKPLEHTRLACLAARVIRSHQIPYVGQVPKILESFLQNH